MSFVITAPEALTAAASDIAGIGSNLTSAHAAAAAPTTGVLAAAADEVSEQIAALFSAHGQGYQRLSAQAAALHDQFVQTLTSGASQYAAAEASAAQTLTNAVTTAKTSVQSVLGHSLIGGAGSGAGGGGGLLSSLGSTLFGGGAVPSLGTASALRLPSTGGLSALSGLSPFLRAAGITNAAAAMPLAFEGISDAIKAGYNAIEPWVQYGFELAQYVVAWVPWVGWFAPQIGIFYHWIEPMVQSLLFNFLDWITGTVSFGQGLNNLINVAVDETIQFFQDQINFFLPPLPPLP
jgi:PE family